MEWENAQNRSKGRAQLMERAQQGDQEAYRSLLEEIGAMLTRMLRWWVSDPQELEDVTQETLLTVHRARHTYHPARPLEPWLFSIARRVAGEHGRRRRARLSIETSVDMLPEIAGEDVGGATARQVSDLMRRLPPSQREAFKLLKLEGLSLEAGAARAGTTTGALKVQPS